jgi:hypothetical protein
VWCSPIHTTTEQYPSYAEQFRVGEMLEFTRHVAPTQTQIEGSVVRSVLTNLTSLHSCQKDNSFCGVLSLFTVFHLPRATHIELFMNIKRYTPLTIASLSFVVLRFALQRASLLIYRHTTMAHVLHAES